MALWLVVALFFIALGLVIKGADWFVNASVEMAEGFHVPKILIGTTLVSVATVAPEFFVSVIAAAVGKVEMSIGNAVGSPIANIGLILGACVCFTFIPVSRGLLKRESVMLLVSVSILFLFSFFGKITRPISISLLFLVFLYISYAIKQAKEARDEWRKNGAIQKSEFNLKREVFIFILGALMVTLGSRLLVLSGSELALHLGVSESVIGLSLVAFGTSLPELFTFIIALQKGHIELSIGNIVGASVLDITLVVGTAGLIHPLPVDRSTHFFAIPILILLSVLLILFGRTREGLQRWEGVIFVVIYAFYCIYLFI